jgi:hypothetical protein
MKNSSAVKRTSLVAILSLSLIAPSTVFAQSGSRLCGWTATMPAGTSLSGTTLPLGGKIGLLYEARQNDSSYSKQCDTVIDEFNSAIKKDPVMSTFTWKKIHKDTCESVGDEFTSTAQTKHDMCDNMEAKKAYSVVKPFNTKEGGAASTSYTKM